MTSLKYHIKYQYRVWHVARDLPVTAFELGASYNERKINMGTEPVVPGHEELIWPALRALRELGGSASHQELLEKVVELEKIPDAVQNIMHAPAAGWTKLSFNLGVAKIASGKSGILDVSPVTKGLWIATERGKAITDEDVRRIVVETRKGRTARRSSSFVEEEALEVEPKWKSDLLQVLTSITPDAFERLL